MNAGRKLGRHPCSRCRGGTNEAALWTEACLTFPTLDALRAGYDVYPVVDAVGGTSVEAHLTGLRRVEQPGVQLISIPQLLCEL